MIRINTRIQKTKSSVRLTTGTIWKETVISTKVMQASGRVSRIISSSSRLTRVTIVGKFTLQAVT